MRRRLVGGTLGLAAAALGATATKAAKHRRVAAQGYSLSPASAVTDPEFEHLLEALTGEGVTSGSCVWATVGSTNMDNRSLAINDELNISVFDTAIVAELDGQFEADVRDAREIDLRRWRQRSASTRVEELSAGAVRQEL